jgi:glucose-6-phosphate-specific signal transduction histidine kinase
LKGQALTEVAMPFWQRLLITLVAMVAASFLAGLIWYWIFGIDLPSYLGGVIGGLTALPVWELLKRIQPKPRATV